MGKKIKISGVLTGFEVSDFGKPVVLKLADGNFLEVSILITHVLRVPLKKDENGFPVYTFTGKTESRCLKQEEVKLLC